MSDKILDENGMNEEEFFKNYDERIFEKQSVTNDILIFTIDDKKESNLRKVPKKGMQVLLIKRKEHPFIQKWAIPGGFVKKNESLKDGAVRKLKEETGVANIYMEQLYTYGEVNRDPRTRVITVANIALISKEGVQLKAGFDAEDAAWFWVEKKFVQKKITEKYIENQYLLMLVSENKKIQINYEVKERIEKSILRNKTIEYNLLSSSNDKLAFDHYKIISDGIDRIRNKVEYTPIAVNLLPRLFTVKDLQLVYEAILGKEILNFRRKIGKMIVETDEVIEGKPYRPAQIYKFNNDFIHEF